MPPRRRIVASAVLVGAGALLGPATARGAAPDTVASRVPVTISATSLVVDQLTYVATVEVATAGGPVPALELEIAGARFDGLGLALPCVPISLGGLTGRTETSGTTTAAQLTVYATDVAATVGGTRVRWSSTDPDFPPPPPGPVTVPGNTFGEPTMVSVFAMSTALHAPSLTTTAGFCSSTAGPALSGVPMTALPTPATSPSTSSTTSGSGSAEPAGPKVSPSAGEPGAPASGQPSGQPSDQSPEPATGSTSEPAPASDGTPGPTGDPSATP